MILSDIPPICRMSHYCNLLTNPLIQHLNSKFRVFLAKNFKDNHENTKRNQKTKHNYVCYYNFRAFVISRFRDKFIVFLFRLVPGSSILSVICYGSKNAASFEIRHSYAMASQAASSTWSHLAYRFWFSQMRPISGRVYRLIIL